MDETHGAAHPQKERESPRDRVEHSLAAVLGAEALGTCFLVATVIGSGILAERLSGGNEALALLANTLATGAILYVLITILAPTSGAHFNPSVTSVAVLRGEKSALTGLAMMASQFAGGVVGAWTAHLMFAEPVLQLSAKLRDGLAQVFSEFVASFGLLLTILLASRHRPREVAAAVALYIVAAYWFTASTSFANPAVTVARMLSDSFAGIAPGSVLPFIGAQLAGALAAAAVAHKFTPPKR